MMKSSEDQVKDIVALKEDLMGQIEEHQEAISRLETNLEIIDMALKNTSFTKASQLAPGPKEPEPAPKPAESSIPIKRGSDGEVLANAYVTPDQVSIVLGDGIEISADTPPFKSFFIDRIIGEMQRKDGKDVESGKIQKESAIDYIINKNGPDIREIIIRNYRQKERVSELISTAGWSLTRMLENASK